MKKRTTKFVDEETPLPATLPKPKAHPTGKVMDISQPPTFPLNKSVTISRCIGPYTENDRKLWAILAAMAWANLDKKRRHVANVNDITKLFRDLNIGTHGSDWVLDSAERLMASRINWKNEQGRGASVLLSGVHIEEKDGTITYEFSDFLIEKLLDNGQFARLRLHFMMGLSGKYSVSLYMLLESAVNLKNPVIELSMVDLRNALSVPDGKLDRWVDLKRFAIEPGIVEINANSAAAGFSVSMEPIGHRRKFDRVRFTVTKCDIRARSDADLKEAAAAKKASAAAKAPGGSNQAASRKPYTKAKAPAQSEPAQYVVNSGPKAAHPFPHEGGLNPHYERLARGHGLSFDQTIIAAAFRHNALTENFALDVEDIEARFVAWCDARPKAKTPTRRKVA